MEGDQAALQSLSSDYLTLLGSSGGELGMLSDVTFCVEGRQVQAHRCILAARSHFFRLLFSQNSPNSHQMSNNMQMSLASASADPVVLPVDVVGYDAFITLLRFLYSGQLILSRIHQQATPLSCPSPTCPHTSCSYAVDLLLELVHAAHFFGINELCELVQTKLGKVLEEGVSVESLMRVLVMAKRQRLERVWLQCVGLINRTSLGCDTLRKYLPSEVFAELADARLQRSVYMQLNRHANNVANVAPTSHDQMHSPQSLMGGSCNEEQRILRLQQALDCMDVELVRLMVMGEGLDLDKALALHYSVANCSREVVKALLELGVVDVNYSDSHGRTALHLAAGMGNAEMIAVLLDHHANPNAATHEGFASVDILRSLMKAGAVDVAIGHPHSGSGAIAPPLLCKADQKRLHLCIELLQSAAAVAGRDDAVETSCVTQAAVQMMMNTQFNNLHNYDRPLMRANIGMGSSQVINHQLMEASRAAKTDSFAATHPIVADHGVQRQNIMIPSPLNHEAANDGSSVFLHHQLGVNNIGSGTSHDDYHQILKNLQPDHHHRHHHHHLHHQQQQAKSTNIGSSSED